MNYKIFLPLIFSIFLISIVSATIVVDGYFQNDIYKTQATINNDESIILNAIFSSTASITSKEISLPSGLNSNEGICTLSPSGHTYSCVYTITPSNTGIFTIQIIGKDSSGSIDSQTLILTVNSVIPPADTIPPVITILGSNPTTIQKGSVYHDAGATARDNVDGVITSRIQITNNVNTDIIGTYFVTYNVEDSSGNEAITKTRTVNVIASNEEDTTPPEITIISPEENHEYEACKIAIKVLTDEEADVTFRLDEGVVTEMNNLSDNTFTYTLNDLSEGKHYLTFYATDDAGNTARESTGFYVKNCEKKCENNDCTSSTRVIQDNSYEQNKYLNQLQSKGIVYSDTSSIPIQKAPGTIELSVSTLFYIILSIIGLGIIIAFYIIFRNIRR